MFHLPIRTFRLQQHLLKILEVSQRSIYTQLVKKIDLQGKKALITGGATGIGLACTDEFLKNGMDKVLIVDMNADCGECAALRFNKIHNRECVKYIKADVKDSKYVDKVYEQAMNFFKGRIDVVFNNAGICTESDWVNMIATNCNSLVYSTLRALDIMSVSKGGKGGTIINTAAIQGVCPSGDVPVYTATKHFHIGFTRSLAMSYHYDKTKVRIMSLCPDCTLTDFTNQSVGATKPIRKITSLDVQPLIYAAYGCLYLLRYCSNGSILVTEGRAIYEIKIPSRLTMATKAIINLCGCIKKLRDTTKDHAVKKPPTIILPDNRTLEQTVGK